jgi:hypothetical protein
MMYFVCAQVCPVCASLPGGDPNHVTDDFAGHLTLEHRSGPRDLISFLISFLYKRYHSIGLHYIILHNNLLRYEP